MNTTRLVSRRVLTLLVAVSLAGTLLVGPNTATAQTGADRTERISDLEKLLGELSAEEAAALRQLDAVRNRRQALDDEIAALQYQIAEAEDSVAAAEAAVDRLTVQYLEFDRQRSETESELRVAHRSFEDAAVALYVSGLDIDRTASMLVLESSDPLAAGVEAVYLREVSGVRREAVASLDDLESALAELLDATEEGRVAAAAARTDARAQRDHLEGLRRVEEERRGEVASQEAREAELVAEIRERADEFEHELAALQATSNLVSDMLRRRQADQTRASSFSVRRPVPGGINSTFGIRLHPILGTTRMHSGVDMAGTYGSSVTAGASGVVVWAAARSGYGTTVIIDHGNQYATLYAHLSETWVGIGDWVEAGEALGAIGTTGLATGPHLHFEVRILGVPSDPLGYMVS